MQAVTPEHREKRPEWTFPVDVCVARPVGKAEIQREPLALQSLLKEWDKLRAAKVWDEGAVREWSQVAAEARRTGTKTHVGRIFEICVEKGAELPRGDPARKYKGRVVFQGNQVHDENWQSALFQQVASCPATMAAAKAADAYGLLTGNGVEQCDAEQAYTQSKLGGTPLGYACQRKGGPSSGREWKTLCVRSSFRCMATPTQGGIGSNTARNTSCRLASPQSRIGGVAFGAQSWS